MMLPKMTDAKGMEIRNQGQNWRYQALGRGEFEFGVGMKQSALDKKEG